MGITDITSKANPQMGLHGLRPFIYSLFIRQKTAAGVALKAWILYFEITITEIHLLPHRPVGMYAPRKLGYSIAGPR